MTKRQVQFRVKRALGALFNRDGALLERNASERAIAAKFALYLVPLFEQYDVDVEYNRHGLQPKAVNLADDCQEAGRKLIVPDIIVHRRGNDDHNLLVIEIKKQNNRESRNCDRAKVRAIKTELSYQYGLILDLPIGSNASGAEVVKEWL